jgi:hypothetical protein
MHNLKSTDTEVLLIILSQHNDDYARLMMKGTNEEFEKCKNTIALIQEELNSRKQNEES